MGSLMTTTRTTTATTPAAAAAAATTTTTTGPELSDPERCPSGVFTAEPTDSTDLVGSRESPATTTTTSTAAAADGGAGVPSNGVLGTGAGAGEGPAAGSSGAGAKSTAAPPPPPPINYHYDKAEIERLGRERPASLANLVIEIGFISSVVMSMMISEYFISGFNLVLPRLAEAIHIPASLQAWPAGVINLSTATLLMVFSRACDIYGGKAVFIGGHVWLVIWSLVCGFSTNHVMLIVCRAMQGIGVAAFMPAGLFLFSQTYRPGPRKNRVFAVWGAFASVGFYSGILVGAISTQFLTWGWYFWIGAIVDAVILALGCLTIPKQFHQRDRSIRMDWWAMLTVVPGLVLVVYSLTDGGHAPAGWRTPYIYVTFILGVLLLAAGVYVEGWVSPQPLIPLGLFKPKGLCRIFIGLFCSYGAFSLFMFYSSYYIQEVMHIGPFLSAAWYSPLAAGGICISIGGGFIMHLVPNRVLMLLSCAGFITTSLLFELIPEKVNGHPSTSYIFWSHVLPAMICGTIGIDLAFNTSNVFTTTQMPMRLQAAASGLVNSIFYLGLSFWLGVSEIAVSEAQRAKGDAWNPRDQYRIPFWLAVALSGLALLLMATVRMGAAAADLTADEKEAQALEADLPPSLVESEAETPERTTTAK